MILRSLQDYNVYVESQLVITMLMWSLCDYKTDLCLSDYNDDVKSLWL